MASQLSFFRGNMSDIAFFTGESRDEILKKLAHLIDYTKLVLFVQGNSGTGKTALLKHRFIRNKKENWKVCVIDANSCRDGNELLTKVAHDMLDGAAFADTSALVEKLDKLRQDGNTPVLVIDNAERLNKDLCQLVGDLGARTMETPALTHLVLFGRLLPKSLEDTLSQAYDNKTEAINTIPLPPLTQNETAEYILFGLQQMDMADSPAFDQKTVDAIYQQSGGLFPKINQQVERVLGSLNVVNRPRRQTQKATGRRNTFLPYKMVATALAISVLASILLLDESPQQPEQPQLAAEGSRDTVELSLPDEKTETPPQTQTTERISISINSRGTPQQKDDTAATRDETVSSAATRSLATAQPVETAKGQMQDQASAVSTAEKVDQSVPKKDQPQPAAPSPPVPKAAATTRQPQSWIEQQPAGNYTLQLTASSRKSSVESYIQRHQLGDKAHYFRSLRKNKDWYSVIYGSYASRQEAQQAIATLPASLKGVKPWIRQYEGIQTSAR